MNQEERLVDIEIKLTRQEDMLDALNQTVFRQQEKIAELEALCVGLASRLRDVHARLPDASDTTPADEKPPHY